MSSSTSRKRSRPDGEDVQAAEQKRFKGLWDRAMKGNSHRVYQKTVVLLLSWQDSDFSQEYESELADLDQIFHHTYGFDTERLSLPISKNPQLHLQRALAEWILNNDNDQVLMILYYGGHGDWRENNGELVLHSKAMSNHLNQTPSVSWSKAEQLFSSIDQADVLVIFDCCGSGAMMRSPTDVHFEHLAACGPGEMTRAPGAQSFTRALIWALKDLQKSDKSWFTTWDLRTQIMRAPDFPPNQTPMLHHRASRPDAIVIRRQDDSKPPSTDPISDAESEPGGQIKPSLDLRFELRADLSEDLINTLARSLQSVIRNDVPEVGAVAFLASHDHDEYDSGTEVLIPVEELIPFQYPSMNLKMRKIRLIEFDSRSTRNDIRLKMSTHDVTGCPVYNALSYVWGPERATHTIVINGGTFKIRSNLHAFLMEWTEGVSIRSDAVMKYWAQRFWIDQLCIDQDDLAERSHQVSIMNEIYREAEHVIVWLGGKTEENDAALSALDSWDSNSRDVCSDNDVTAIRSFIDSNPYWSRLWVVQEVLLAKQLAVYCGGSTLDWTKLQQFVHKHFGQKIGEFRSRTRSRANGLLLVGYVATSIKRRDCYELMELLDYFCPEEYDCRDLHDKVYALRGLLNEDEKRHLPIDYSNDLPGVYKAAVSTCMRACPPPDSLQDFTSSKWGQARDKQHAFIRLAKTMHMPNLQGGDEELFAKGLLRSWQDEYAGSRPGMLQRSSLPQSTTQQSLIARVIAFVRDSWSMQSPFTA